MLFASACEPAQLQITPTIHTTTIEKTRLVEVIRVVKGTVIVNMMVPSPTITAIPPAIEVPTFVPELAPAPTEVIQSHHPLYVAMVSASLGVQLMIPRSRHTLTLLSHDIVFVVDGNKNGDEHYQMLKSSIRRMV